MRRLISLGCALLLGLLLVLLNIGVSAAQDATPGIIITEVLAANARTVTDDRGRYVDWIELHNPTDTPTSLAGYTLTDDPDEPAKWRLPVTTLAPGRLSGGLGFGCKPGGAGRLAYELPAKPRRGVRGLVRSGWATGGRGDVWRTGGGCLARAAGYSF